MSGIRSHSRSDLGLLSKSRPDNMTMTKPIEEVQMAVELQESKPKCHTCNSAVQKGGILSSGLNNIKCCSFRWKISHQV
ncbi:hypothetical protein NPIL_275241 [Nephila pilipes]|uniref:Uncharacterized protein n=1 Tax=Nephila pilipes TaxID=299642 RepID=A0A8X6UV91_NEPPI|nr:hypothetical protein NPIL_275241 [Nephila pilipes]